MPGGRVSGGHGRGGTVVGDGSYRLPAAIAELGATSLGQIVGTLELKRAATGVIWSTNFHALKPLIDFGSSFRLA